MSFLNTVCLSVELACRKRDLLSTIVSSTPSTTSSGAVAGDGSTFWSEAHLF
jgi:hypothetical protein